MPNEVKKMKAAHDAENIAAEKLKIYGKAEAIRYFQQSDVKAAISDWYGEGRYFFELELLKRLPF